ncbi:MAG: hypothetical protein UR69_C0003G0074 [Candidatus Moranbacteria bacterium GW2011_GWE2_35_2-]|nr:MAG: hypothetical protein UR69_C0003G0074 [Candidatus Moranbacteria bacterium GW2011_GWE2_35_2-]KKQ06896.1 MAG: hypothetical protein US15_C0001G0003 [Candidatus Moranbacteria bacterium GW2011_GWF1_36_4]KKQ22092.1 MAG: hypothetical protein US37_C0004G0051 [Candidatus Moranbacteria bacterium GW2011_GWF2_37_11]KKQ29155.1 MAG: hypothetical protein US44_C0003G0067 [Candidatus Moranbacteria bacterium GW2011_GWD1_37_17]KKQ31140.1 MAG: hypothetical protein US47_C0001G0373 [Candidatus Moranbacteria b
MQKIIFGLAGEVASGKGTVSKYLQEKHGAKVRRFSDFLRITLDAWHLEIKRENLAKLSLIMRQGFGEDVFSKAIVQGVLGDKENIVIVDGIRRIEDIEDLKKLEGFKFVYVETSLEKRYERIIKRGENSDDKTKTFEQFKKDHELETEVGIKELKTHADVIIENNGTLEDLQKQIDELVK